MRLANPAKYLANSSKDADRILYCHPRSAERLKKPNTKVVVVEAEKSCLAGESFMEREGRDDFAFVAMGGAYGWRSKEDGVLSDVAAVRKGFCDIDPCGRGIGECSNIGAWIL